MTDCPSCKLAEEHPNCGAIRDGCMECIARNLSWSPMYFFASQANALTPAYRGALQTAFGADWQKGHERVKAWSMKRMKERDAAKS